MELSLAVDGTLLLVGALLVVGVLVAAVSHRIRVPGSLLFLGLGMLVGAEGLGIASVEEADLAQNLGAAALVVILFEGGLTTHMAALRRGAVPGLLLSNIGVLVTTLVMGTALVVVLDVSWHTGLLFGAIVSPTDAAAVFDLLRRAPLPARAAATLEVESGANDPFAIVLTIGLLEASSRSVSASEWLWFGANQLVGGLALGLLVGVGGAWLLRQARLPAFGLYPVLALAIAGVAYGLGASMGGSGFLAVYVAGLVIGRRAPRHRRLIRNFSTSLATTADIGLFLLLGLLVSPSSLGGVILPALVVTVILLVVARPVAVALCLGPLRVPWREQLVVSWAGLRGAVPIVLATFPLTSGYPGGETIFDVVFFVVLVSVAVQGATVPALVTRLGLATTRAAWESLADVVPFEGLDADLVELTITELMTIADVPLRDLTIPEGIVVLAVIRGASTLVPTGATILHPDDVALIAVSEDEDPAALVLAWANPAPEPPVPA